MSKSREAEPLRCFFIMYKKRYSRCVLGAGRGCRRGREKRAEKIQTGVFANTVKSKTGKDKQKEAHRMFEKGTMNCCEKEGK